MSLKNCRIHKINATQAEYQAIKGRPGDVDFVMSRSELVRFADCPSKWRAGIPHRETTSTRWGNLMDLVVSGAWDDVAVEYPATYVDSKGKEKPFTLRSDTCTAWVEDQLAAGKLPVSHKEVRSVRDACGRWGSEIHSLISACQKQVVILGEYHDRKTGLVIPVKCAIDLVPPPDFQPVFQALGDFKTGRTAQPRAWRREVRSFAYDVQGWEYLTMWNQATGENRNTFFQIVQENTAPYEVSRKILTQEFLDVGEHEWKKAMQLYCACLASNKWPTYDDAERNFHGWSFVEPEPWMMGSSTTYELPEPDEEVGEEIEPEGEVVP